MRRDSWPGDLTLGNSRPGAIVRCVQNPGQRFMSFWGKIMGLQGFHYKPVLKEKYFVRANVVGPQGFDAYFATGIVLSQWPDHTPLVNTSVNLKLVSQVGMHIEPYFPFDCFDLLGANRP
jgi:hypothetical protein